MKQFLIYLLLIANIYSGIVLARDYHLDSVVHHNDAATLDVLTNSAPDLSDGGVQHGNISEHACHGAAHLTGIFYSVSPSTMESTCNRYSALSFALPAQYISPHLRPPII